MSAKKMKGLGGIMFACDKKKDISYKPLKVSKFTNVFIVRVNQHDFKFRIFKDYDWEQDQMIKYRANDKGGIDRL